MICGGTRDFSLSWKCINLLFRNRCAQSWRGGIWNTRGKLRARSHFLASNFLVIILTMKNNNLQAVFLFEVVFYITETMMNGFNHRSCSCSCSSLRGMIHPNPSCLSNMYSSVISLCCDAASISGDIPYWDFSKSSSPR